MGVLGRIQDFSIAVPGVPSCYANGMISRAMTRFITITTTPGEKRLMRRFELTDFGAGNLKLTDTEPPLPGPGEVVVKVHAASVPGSAGNVSAVENFANNSSALSL